jgi:hypothetical protein
MNEVGFGVLPGYLKTADLEELWFNAKDSSD